MDVFERFTAKSYVTHHRFTLPSETHRLIYRSDPVIEPMLQAIPDPFDSYGPPTTDDQIFSILPPLMTATSPGPTSIASTPHLDTRDLGISPTRPSWMPTVPQLGAGGYFTEANSAWADVPSPSRTPTVTPPPKSPPQKRAKSPQQKEGGAFGVFRRNSHPLPAAGGTKAESKLRSVLTAIDESNIRPSNGSNGTGKDPESPDTPTNTEIPSGINGVARSASDKLGLTLNVGRGGVGNWGQDSLDDPSDESESEINPTTPRRSTTFMPTSSDPSSPVLKGHGRDASKTPTAEPVALPT